MQRPSYLEKYRFNWEALNVMVGGMSALDTNSYLGKIDGKDSVENFLLGYGFDYNDPIQKAELFGNFQEAIQFVKRYFLKEGNPEGLDLKVPNILYTITDISQLFVIASKGLEDPNERENAIWAGIILKVMHTILHTDKDLRYRYFSTIQLQIFDRIYKYIKREGNELCLYSEQSGERIPLVEFETKSKKTRDSIIIKLLHKKENVAEELFDRIGIRFVTQNKVDTLRVLKFLHNDYVVMPHNIKPSRSINSLFDMETFQSKHKALIKAAIKNELPEEEFYNQVNQALEESPPIEHYNKHNKHSSNQYHAIHFTCRHLIKYRNPFMDNFSDIRKLAKTYDENDPLAKKLLELDTSSIARVVRFFYPYEIQITDEASHKKNTEGEANHKDYKKAQLKSAMKRIFKSLIELKGLSFN